MLDKIHGQGKLKIPAALVNHLVESNIRNRLKSEKPNIQQAMIQTNGKRKY